MTDTIERILEVSLGAVLIGITLVGGTITSTATIGPALILLPLIAVPIICAGMFAWHPFKSAIKLFTHTIASVKQFEIIKPHSSSL